MRDLFLVILGVVAITMAAPASAQTYDPSYPVCLQIFAALDGGNYIECSHLGHRYCDSCRARKYGLPAD